MRILVTGGAGFIGSNLVEHLYKAGSYIYTGVGQPGHRNGKNLESFEAGERFEWIEGDIRRYKTCLQACEGMDLVSHQAALGSVPRSVNDPLTTNEVNITGTLNILTAAKETGIKRVVYASSSSAYGNHPDLPKKEEKIGLPLSPYAVTKYVAELYAQVYAAVYELETIGLRYFNIFGPKQDPDGAYAAVIPIFIKAVLNNEPPVINGTGENSRDFTYITNAVQANVCALFTRNANAVNEVYNIAGGGQMDLNELFTKIKGIAGSDLVPRYGPERKGDVQHSLADISKAAQLLGYQPQTSVHEGLKQTFEWYRERHHFSYST